MQKESNRRDFDELAMLIMHAIQDDYEAIPHILKGLNGSRPWQISLHREITIEEVIHAVEGLLGGGLIQASYDNGHELVEIEPSQIGDLRTDANLVYSRWPISGTTWFKPTQRGQDEYEKWAASKGIMRGLVHDRGNKTKIIVLQKTVIERGISVTLKSIDCYEDCFVVNGSIVDSRNPQGALTLIQVEVSAGDDRETEYRTQPERGSGNDLHPEN